MKAEERETGRLTETVNRSGFPLQLRVEHLVNTGGRNEGWRVLYKEHAWRNREEGEGGFIDLVLENQGKGMVLVIECKRRLGTSWIFLSGLRSTLRRHARVWVTHNEPQGIKHFDWSDIAFSPSSPESEFCVVADEDSTQRPLLERIASELTLATEALAEEDRAFVQSQQVPLRMYASVIVTTAVLKLCSFDAEAVSLDEGKIADAKFHDVECVRFRKQLSTVKTDPLSFASLASVRSDARSSFAKAKEHTVFVVGAPHLAKFLTEIEGDNDDLVQKIALR